VSDVEDANKIATTFPALDGWRDRAAVPFRPQPGSELHADDQDWPGMPVTQVAASSMAAAVDHLQAFRILLEQRQLFAFANPSLLRTALLSAAQAVWVLAPDAASERVANARTLAPHIYVEHQKFLNDLQPLSPTAHKGTDTVAELVTTRLPELTALRDRDGQTAKFEATATIAAAARATWDLPTAALEARSEWRRSSGAAHGLMWSVLGHPENKVGEVEDDGLAPIQVGGSVGAIINLYCCAYGFLAKAHRLLDQRGTAPTPSTNAHDADDAR
jgi:hypothetical protein